MSRVVSRSEQEPLMRLQRPSSASSQDTAHLVNACLRHFLENSSTPVPMLDRGKVDNLRVSSAEQRDGYHKRYVELLKTVYDEHQRRINEIDHVEKHLIMAKAASLAAEEKALSTLDQQLGLPKGPCQLPHNLDETLLRQNHLLVPSNYLIVSRPPVPAPQPPSTPSYIKPTFTSDQHSKVTYGQYVATRKATSPKKPTVSSITQSTIKKAQAVSSSCVLEIIKATDDAADTIASEAGRFVASPSSIIFTDYLPGQTYTATLQLTNSSGASRQISVTQPSTPYFAVRVGTFPTSEGSLAPGISCTYLVSFFPNSIATFDDCVKVMSYEGVCLSVPLLGRRPQPLLEVSSLPVWYSHPSSSSDNIITCHNTGTGSGSYTIDHLEADELHGSHFTLSPTTFDLAPDCEINVKVTFYADMAGEFTQPIIISCNNGDNMELTLIGCCEVARVGVATVRPATSEHEVEQWTAVEAPPTTTGDGDYPISNNEQVLFDTVNPCQSGYQIVIIRNCCHMGLPYHWSLYRPITVPTSQPVPSLHSSYNIKPHSGTLAADCTTAFLVTFTPQQPGHFSDVAFLTLDNNEATQLTPTVQLHLSGACDEYDVILSPWCMAIPGSVQCGINHCYRIKVVNNSLSSVFYQWQEVFEEKVVMKVEPNEGYIVPDGVGHCELIIRPLLVGDIVVDLHCIILHRSQPLVISIRAIAQAQALILDTPSLNYGLIANGTAKTLQLPIRNDAEIAIKFCLSEMTPPNQQSCLVCIPADGEVLPHDTLVCTVKCDTSLDPLGRVDTHASLRSTLSCITELGAQSCVQVLGEVQSPRVCLKSCGLHVDDAYVNIPTEHVISLCNMTMVPAQFNWKDQLFGDGASCCSACITPSHGLLSPRSSCDLVLTVVWNTEGEDIPAAVLCCEVNEMKEPILLSVTGHVHGLSIHYTVMDSPDDEQCHLDFGNTNPLGVTPHPVYLKVINDTAIPTSLVATAMHFPSGLTQDSKLAENDGNTLLNMTVNLANPKSMSDKSSQSALTGQVLSKGRGCGFVVTPSELDLPPYSCHVIQVTAYSDMWGVYTDQLKCQVSGLPPVLIPISYGVVGCPILFTTTATYGFTTVRFGSHPVDGGLVRRTIKLKNTGPCEITVDWEVFNIVPDDQQLIDLTVAVGRPFPITDHDQSFNDNVVDDDVMKKLCGLVKVMIKAHEGIVSSNPITINPKQTVIKGYSIASLELTLTPTIMEAKDGSTSSYILGHMSLTSEHDYCSEAVRAEGYDIDPVRINVTGKSLYPRLTVQYDNDDGIDDKVVFQFTADKLFSTSGEVKSSYYTRCCVNLNNSTDMRLSFDLLTHPPFSCSLTVTPPVTLIPNCSAQACIGYELTLDEVVESSRSKLSNPPVVKNVGGLTIRYSTGVEQSLSLTARVLLPVLSVNVECVAFGARLLDQPTSQIVTVYNNSNCTSQWNLSVMSVKELSCSSKECSELSSCFTVAPSSGKTQPQQSTDVKVTFTPNKEIDYAAVINIIGVLGDHVSFTVSGSGSADEATLLSLTV